MKIVSVWISQTKIYSKMEISIVWSWIELEELFLGQTVGACHSKSNDKKVSTCHSRSCDGKKKVFPK